MRRVGVDQIRLFTTKRSSNTSARVCSPAEVPSWFGSLMPMHQIVSPRAAGASGVARVAELQQARDDRVA